jgi:hypothetical protein
MNKIEAQVNKYLADAIEGKATMSQEILDRFGERCKEALSKQFNEEKQPFRLRMSTIGKPLCQQQLEKAGAKSEEPEPSLKLKLTYGDIVEALMMAVMEASEVNIEEFQSKVEYELAGTTINGTLDVIIDGKVYDIKSTSKYAFDNKFSDENGFQKIVEDDPFGYVSQGYLYAEAKGIPFGGWIAFSKESGRWCVTEAPERGEAYARKAIGDARRNVKSLEDEEPFERCFTPQPFTYSKMQTKEQVLHVTCQYCKFKETCWGDEIEYRQARNFTASNGKKYYPKSWKWFFK